MKCPECEQGKTDNCVLVALDFDSDSFVPCETNTSFIEVVCYGHSGPGMIREWAECPVCSPEEEES